MEEYTKEDAIKVLKEIIKRLKNNTDKFSYFEFQINQAGYDDFLQEVQYTIHVTRLKEKPKKIIPSSKVKGNYKRKMNIVS